MTVIISQGGRGEPAFAPLPTTSGGELHQPGADHRDARTGFLPVVPGLPAAHQRLAVLGPGEVPAAQDLPEHRVHRVRGSSVEALEQQLLSRRKEQTLVGGRRVPWQELPELPKEAVTTVHRVKVSLYGAKPPVWRRLEIPSAMPLNLMHAVLQVAFDWHDSGRLSQAMPGVDLHEPDGVGVPAAGATVRSGYKTEP
jgi:hypothetical protein